MDNVINLDRGSTQQEAVGARSVDVRRGGRNGELSAQWRSRPDDQRFLSLEELLAHVAGRAERSYADTIDTKSIEVVADGESRLDLKLPTGDVVTPTHWAFGQLCSQVKAPAGYLRTLPAAIAQFPLQYGMVANRTEVAKFFATSEGEGQPHLLRAVTSPNYGRIMDAEVVHRVMNIAGDDWKVPGTINWSTGQHDPNTPVTKDSTTLYASDRDVFVFLCRDQYPIEIGKLENGEPDYLFPGFIVSNSETGNGSLRIETMFLRGVCQNRNLWGVEGQESLRIRHTKYAPDRLDIEAGPVLESFANEARSAVVKKVTDAKSITVAGDHDERMKFLINQGFAATKSGQILESFKKDEGHDASSVWDFVQAMTASARDVAHQDARIVIERKAGGLMDHVT